MNLKEIHFNNIFDTKCGEKMNLMFCGTGMYSTFFKSLDLTNGFVINSEYEDIFLNCGQAGLDELKLGNDFLLHENMCDSNNTLELFEQTGSENCNIWWSKQCNDSFEKYNLKSCKCFKTYTTE